MIDVKKLAEKAGAHHSAVTSAQCFRTRELEAFASLVLEEAAVECDSIWQEDGSAMQCREAIRAMKPAKEQKT